MDHALQEALNEFQDSLTPAERGRYQALKVVPDASAVMTLTAQLDDENAKRKTRCVASRVSNVLESVQQFSGVIGIFVSSNPTIAALVWGSISLMLSVSGPNPSTL